MSTRIRADFNGIFGDLLCLSHSESAKDEENNDVLLSNGMNVTAFEEDTDEHGNPDQLLSHGVVVESPEWLQCLGSRWALQMDDRGVYHESDLNQR
jgi:hypothetical protein